VLGRPLLEFVLVLLGCLASGTLECGRVELTPAQAQGQELYGRMCAVCHGRVGEGYAADHAPALAHPDFLASASDDYLTLAVARGRSGTTMSAWSTGPGGPLGPADLDAVVAFLRTWQRGAPAVLDRRPLAGNSARGGPLFARECVNCHGAGGTGGPEEHIGNRGLLESATDGFLRYAIRHGRPGTSMPSFERTLGEAGTDDVIALLRGLPSEAATKSIVSPGPPVRTGPIPLGPVPLNPRGPEPQGFSVQPATTPADLVKAQMDRGARMGILDARAPSDYVTEHIAGAVSVPFYDPDSYAASLPKNAWLVCYCACPHAESGQLATKLAAKGFAKVTVLDEGLGVWKMKKYPTRSGIEP
jgi:cytochrome c oxidase cbb3-type subunit 3